MTEGDARMKTRPGTFLFNNPKAQTDEAHRNAQEAEQLCERWAPKHLRLPPQPELETTAAGACFRNVSRILKGRGR